MQGPLEFEEDDKVTISIPLEKEFAPQDLGLISGTRRQWYTKPEIQIYLIAGILLLQWLTSIILSIIIYKGLGNNIAPVANGVENGIAEIKNLETVISSLTSTVQELIKKIP